MNTERLDKPQIEITYFSKPLRHLFCHAVSNDDRFLFTLFKNTTAKNVEILVFFTQNFKQAANFNE